MNIAEQDNYNKLHDQVEQGNVQARQEIEETKAELVEAKRIRKNRMEYDALAKVGFKKSNGFGNENSVAGNSDTSNEGRKSK